MITISNVNPDKLLEELINNGVNVKLLEHDKESGKHIAENSYLYLDDGENLELVNSIINAHDPSPNPSIPTAEERIEMLEYMILLMMEG